MKDKRITDLENLPEPDLLAHQIIDNIESALSSFEKTMEMLNDEQNLSCNIANDFENAKQIYFNKKRHR